MTALTSPIPGLFDGFFSVQVTQEIARPMFGAARYEDGLFRRYVFYEPRIYYRFLAILAADPDHPLCRCAYCGKPFCPSSGRKMKYCDRIQPNGRTCRQLGPVDSHRKAAAEDPVIGAFGRAKRRMYKRMERTNNDMAGAAILSMAAYFDWLTAAETARTQYRAGAISQEEALRIISADRPGNKIDVNLIQS